MEFGFLAPEVLPLLFDCCEVRSNALYDAVLDSDDGALLRYSLLQARDELHYFLQLDASSRSFG